MTLCACFIETDSGTRQAIKKKTDWQPASGYDPKLRQFKCSKCGQLSYRLLTDTELDEENSKDGTGC